MGEIFEKFLGWMPALSRWVMARLKPYAGDYDRFNQIIKLFPAELVDEIRNIHSSGFNKSIWDDLLDSDKGLDLLQYEEFLDGELQSKEEEFRDALYDLINIIEKNTPSHFLNMKHISTYNLGLGVSLDIINHKNAEEIEEAVGDFENAYGEFRKLGNRKFAERMP